MLGLFLYDLVKRIALFVVAIRISIIISYQDECEDEFRMEGKHRQVKNIYLRVTNKKFNKWYSIRRIAGQWQPEGNTK